jgi:hypothetical protein
MLPKDGINSVCHPPTRIPAAHPDVFTISHAEESKSGRNRRFLTMQSGHIGTRRPQFGVRLSQVGLTPCA